MAGDEPPETGHQPAWPEVELVHPSAFPAAGAAGHPWAKPISFPWLIVVTIVSTAVALFCRQQWGSEWLEVAGFITGVVYIYLTAVEHISLWPVSIVNAVLYTVLFLQGKLYGDATLQVIFFILSIHGWYLWARGGEKKTEIPMTKLTVRGWVISMGTVVVGTAIYWPLLILWKDSSPFLDALLTVASLVAQVLVNRKIIENWWMWIVINFIYVPFYIQKVYYPTAILYGIFFVLSVLGIVNWIKTHRRLQTA